ncbi:MAG: hypothetical protein WA418_26250, partial [Bradyrhizobium sp.]
LEDLAVPRHDPRKTAPETSVIAAGLINDFHGVFGLWRIDGYDSVIETLTNSFELWRGGEGQTNLIAFPYDWRLSNRVAAAQLKALIERRLPEFRKATNNPGAKVILVGHSMGGLVARYYLEVLEGWRDCRALVSFGTPYRGAVGPLDYLSNGYKNTLLGQTFVELTTVLRSMPAVYELLPRYRALKHNDVWCRPAEAGPLPGIDQDYARAALDFHLEIDAAVQRNGKDADYMKERYLVFPVVGAGQPTMNSAVFKEGGILCSEGNPDWLDPELEAGDGTVPRVSATPEDRTTEFREIFFAERHASLQCNDSILFDLIERIKQMQAPKHAPALGGVLLTVPALGLAIQELYAPGEPAEVVVRAKDIDRFGKLHAVAVRSGAEGAKATFTRSGDHWRANLGELSAGQYRITVATEKSGSGAPTPVHDVFEVAR